MSPGFPLRVPLALGFLQGLPGPSCLERGRGVEFAFVLELQQIQQRRGWFQLYLVGPSLTFSSFASPFPLQHPAVRAGGAHRCEHEQSLHGGDGQAQELREPEAVSVTPLGRGHGAGLGWRLLDVSDSTCSAFPAAQQVCAQEKSAQISIGTLRFPS